MTDQTIEWLRELGRKGDKGVVHNIDARNLLRIAHRLEAMTTALRQIRSLDEKNAPKSKGIAEEALLKASVTQP